MLRRFAIAATVLTSVGLLCGPALADSVPLSGVVDDITTVVSTPTGAAGALNLYGENTANPDTVVKVADLAITSNSSNGVSLTATAAGDLTHGANSLAYQVLIVGDGDAAPTAVSFSDTTDTEANVTIVAGAAARDLYIEYDAPAYLDAGTYTSSITVSVTDN